MLYYPDGSRKPSTGLRDTIVVRVDMEKPREHEQGHLSRFALHRQICAAAVATVIRDYDIEGRVDCCLRVRVSVDLKNVRTTGGKRDIARALETTFELDLTFDPDDLGDDAEELASQPAEVRLLRVVENHLTLAWEAYRLDQFTWDASVVIDGLRTMLHRERRSVHDVLKALQELEMIDILHGRTHDGYWRFERRRQGERLEGWLEGLPDASDVLLVDEAGRTLVVNEFGRLAIGPNVAERVAEQARLMASASQETPSTPLRTASR
ncbi:hypothetical protein ABMY26_33320 [Azospirillum sp. HJ39]|uniref:hypothetical protein n=1 Tax=Azospirillum sp. HJ39 TaxID=3159496 RepID=UPI0035578BC5